MWDVGELFGEKLAIDLILPHLYPGAPAVFAQNGDVGVDELAILEHLEARIAAGVSKR